MYLKRLHRWDLSPKEAVALQRELASRVEAMGEVDPASLSLIAGVDVSSTRFEQTLTAGIIVWERETGNIVERVAVQEKGEFPYIPGLLSFREIPVLEKAIERVKSEPQIVLVDGQGIAHPRGIGIASHLGLLLDVPTIGVGKSKLCGEHEELSPDAGSLTPLLFQGMQVGIVYRSKRNSNPLFLSPGHGISQESAFDVVVSCFRGYRLPEPTRLAHQYVNEVRRGVSSVHVDEAVDGGLFARSTP